MARTEDTPKIRVLCLHGSGSNSRVFESQTAALRQEIGDNYEWHFVEGTIPVPMDDGLKGYFPADDDYFSFFDPTSPESFARAMDALEDYAIFEGPFDFIGASCVSASLASSLLLSLQNRAPSSSASSSSPSDSSDSSSLFKGAFFFNGMTPVDASGAALSPSSSSSEEEKESSNTYLPFGNGSNPTALTIGVPTTNIWGRNDTVRAPYSSVMRNYCSADVHEEVTHDAAGTIPGAGSEEVLVRAAHAIRRTVERASLVC